MQQLKELVEYWQEKFDWRGVEARLNKYPQFTTDIDGVSVHYLHVRSPEPNATPLLLTHGWPGTFAEFLDIIEPLTNPTAHGGRPEDAFDLVIPSIPGFAFSEQPHEPGWTMERIALAWAELMRRLGYHGYIPQGGDIGAWISLVLAAVDSDAVRGVHVNFLVTPPPDDPEEFKSLSPEELQRLMTLRDFKEDGAGYMILQATRPQTISYSLTDSPVGQLAWMYEKFHMWSDQTSGEAPLSFDQILTNATIYWLTGSAGSAAHFYFDNASNLPAAPVRPPDPPVLNTPLGVASFINDQAPSIRRLAGRGYADIVQWTDYERGGHFAAMEGPAALVEDLRRFKRALDARESNAGN